MISTSIPKNQRSTLPGFTKNARAQAFSLALNTRSLNIRGEIVIARSTPQVYSFWRNFENFSGQWPGIVSVMTTGPFNSHWLVKAGMSVLEWDMVITSTQENKYISWHSTGGSVSTGGEVLFSALSAAETAVEVTIHQCQPAPYLLEAIRLELFKDLKSKLQYGLHCIKADIEGRQDTPVVYTYLA